jgi:hypothetical protein
VFVVILMIIPMDPRGEEEAIKQSGRYLTERFPLRRERRKNAGARIAQPA